jgi:hypothetical protein
MMFHSSSALGQVRPASVLRTSSFIGPASGCQGHSSLRSSAPGPLGAVGCPLADARDLPIRVDPARFRPKGQGLCPRHPCSLRSPADAGRWPFTDFQASTRSRRVSVCQGRQRHFVLRGLYPFPAFHHGCKKSSNGFSKPVPSCVLASGGEAVATSTRALTGAALRCHRNRALSRAGNRIFFVRPGTFHFVPPFLMDTKSTTAKQSPVRVCRCEDVSASIFAHEHEARGQETTFYSVSISRSYVDTDGKRKYTNFLTPESLPRAQQVIEEAAAEVRELQYAAKK